jgi:hypothetical protein
LPKPSKVKAAFASGEKVLEKKPKVDSVTPEASAGQVTKKV